MGRPVKTKYFAQLVALSALWGASFMLIRIASPVLGPSVLAALRIGVATLTLAALMRLLGQRWPRRHWRELAVLGALSVALPFLLFAWAALHLPAGYSALLNTTAVVFGIFAAAALKEDTLTDAQTRGLRLWFRRRCADRRSRSGRSLAQGRAGGVGVYARVGLLRDINAVDEACPGPHAAA